MSDAAVRDALDAADAGRVALLLAPATACGWLDGRALAACDGEVEADVSRAHAAAALEAAFEGTGPPAVALLSYEGRADVVTFADVEVVPRDEALACISERTRPRRDAPLIADARTSLDASEYRIAVDVVRERIAAGDVYVLNLTRRISGRATATPAAGFAALVERGGADMSALLSLGNRALLSVSPERFVRMRRLEGSRHVDISPIKGTRPRSSDPAADAAAAEDVLRDEKERAEHVMVVDLERNDLGRVCEPGTVRVDPLYDVVPTPYCHQMVSTVHGLMRSDATVHDLLEATFPCGSVTGAPKIAAVDIARGLEAGPRGAYCGALVVAVPALLDSSVLIRTLDVDEDAASWGTGAGITWHSDPAAEWLETVLKASPAVGDGTPPVALRETCRAVDGGVPLLDRHLARLAAGGCGPSVLGRVRLEVARAVASADEQPSRLSIDVSPQGVVDVRMSIVPSSLDVTDGPTIALVEVGEPPTLPPGGAKPANRSEWDEAQERARTRGADIAVLVDGDGTVIDGATASVWVRHGRELVTPLAPPALDGVARSVVIERAAELGLGARAGVVRAEDLDTADEVLLTNAYGGAVGVRGRDAGTAAHLDALIWEQGRAGA